MACWRWTRSYLGGLVECVDVLNVVHQSKLVVAVELVNVLDGLLWLLGKATGSLTSTGTKQHVYTMLMNRSAMMQEENECWTLERAERTVESVHAGFFLLFFCTERPLPAAAPSADGFLFSLGACPAPGRGTFFVVTFLAGFVTARAATGWAGATAASAFCRTNHWGDQKDQIRRLGCEKSQNWTRFVLFTLFAKAAFMSWAPKLLVMGRWIPSGSLIAL